MSFFFGLKKKQSVNIFWGLVIAQPTTVNDVILDSFLKLIGSKASLVS